MEPRGWMGGGRGRHTTCMRPCLRLFEYYPKKWVPDRHPMTAQAAETGILPVSVVYSASTTNGRINNWTGYIEDRRAMRVVWHAGPPTCYGSQSEWPTIYTADAFAWDNQAGQRLAAAINGTSSGDNGRDGIGGSDHLSKALAVVNSKQRPPAWLKWLKNKLDLATTPLPVQKKKRNNKSKPKSVALATSENCTKCKVPGCKGFFCFLFENLEVSPNGA